MENKDAPNNFIASKEDLEIKIANLEKEVESLQKTSDKIQQASIAKLGQIQLLREQVESIEG